MTKRFLITGGAGFIGSAVVRHLVRETDHRVCVVDKLTYAGNLASLAPVANNPRYSFVRADIADADKMKSVFASYRPDVVMHLAAESHVDRSIDGPAAFMQTNIIGTYVLLEAALAYWRALPNERAERFSLPSYFDRRGFRLAGRGRQLHRGNRLRSALALFGIKGRVRPSGTRLASHLRPAGAGHQLLQQLRPLSLSRKAHSVDDHQRSRRDEAAGLRHRRQRARLALRRGSRPRAARRRQARAGSARLIASAAAASGPISTW